MTQRLLKIPTLPGMGRSIIQHDEASKNFRATALVADDAEPETKVWRRGQAYDQGQTPECVAYTGKGLLNSKPIDEKIDYDIRSEYDPDVIYHGAQQYDEWPGESYDGTSGLGLCKYLKALGKIQEYRWCFGLQDLLLTVSHVGPVGLGMWWKQPMFTPDSQGIVRYTGDNAGGHEFEVMGLYWEEELFVCMNSWSEEWGDRGRFYLPIPDMEKALADQADAFVIVR